MNCPNCNTRMDYIGIRDTDTGIPTTKKPVSWNLCMTCGGAFGLPAGNSDSLFHPTALTFKQYEELAHKTAVYPVDKTYEYLALGISNEAGEVAGKIKKWLRGDYKEINFEDFKIMLRAEIGDVIWYASELSRVIGGFELVARENLVKLKKRQQENKLLGDGDQR